ncbi:MAG: hypothetical protein GOU99_02335 [Candidatus Altiarchaeota archaeon]|nr:hypothetical protein [Candidatus Altiarchaeota archaeon]
MADKKKPAIGASVPGPNEKADFFAQLMNTFERGVVSAEIDLGGTFAKEGAGGGLAIRAETGPRSVTDRQVAKVKDIVNTFAGDITVHAPMKADPAGLTGIERAKAAEILKQSIEYSKRVGAKTLTVHPIGSMGYYFIEPFVGTKLPVQSPFMLAANKQELNKLFQEYNVKDELMKEQIKREWGNFIQTLPLTFAEKFAAAAAPIHDNFKTNVAQERVVDLFKQHSNDLGKVLSDIKKVNNIDEEIRSRMMTQFMRLAPEGKLDNKMLNEFKKHFANPEVQNFIEGQWSKVNLASLSPIGRHGEVAKNQRQELELREKAWEKIMTREGMRFGPFSDSKSMIMKNVEDTFSKLLKDKETQKMLKQGKVKIALENLFPAAPEKGYMQGYPMFYKPAEMAKLVKKIRSIAKANGVSPDLITMTFDVGHSASSNIKPSEFLKELKKHGVKPGHVHLVGGPGFGHQHEAWGDWMDEVSRMDPGLFKNLMDMGVVNIEGADIEDIEITVNNMWNDGVPLEALMAMSTAPGQVMPSMVEKAGYSHAPSYWEGVARGYSQGFFSRGMYSFQYETLGAPMRAAFGGYLAPALHGGGHTIGPDRTPLIWASSQPTLYSSKRQG